MKALVMVLFAPVIIVFTLCFFLLTAILFFSGNLETVMRLAAGCGKCQGA